MKALYAKFILWLIRPALEKHRAEVRPLWQVDIEKERAAIEECLERAMFFAEKD